MGLGNNSAAKVYLGIKEGKITHRRDENTTDYYDHIAGQLIDVYVKEDGKFGRELHIIIRDGQDQYVLQMRLESGYARAFLRVIKNAALSEPMMLIPVYKITADSLQAGMIITQFGSALKWYYTRNNPNGMPELEPCKMKDPKTGKVVDGWDNTRQMEFLTNVLNSEIRPALASVGRERITASSAPDNPVKTAAQTTNEMYASWQHFEQQGNPDDLPF